MPAEPTVTVTSSHREHNRTRQALTRIAGFFAELRKTAEQLTDLDGTSRLKRIPNRAAWPKGGTQLELGRGS
jgi:hypothetical protein